MQRCAAAGRHVGGSGQSDRSRLWPSALSGTRAGLCDCP